MGLPDFLKITRTPRRGGVLPRPAEDVDAALPGYVEPTTPGTQFLGPSVTAVKPANGPGWWDDMKPALVQGLARGGVAGALGGAAVVGLGRLIKGFADGGDLTPYLGKRVRVGERGPELVVDDDGNVQPVGLDGPEEGMPVRPGMVIPNEQLSDDGHALLQRFAQDAGGAASPPQVGAQGQASTGTATRPRRATPLLTPEQSLNVVNSIASRRDDAPVPDERAAVADSITPQPTLPVPRLPGRAPGAFEPSRVPVIGKARSLPAPGEEEANDAGVRERMDASGGFDEGGGGATASRPRIADPTGRLDEQINYERQHPATDGNGWFKSLLKHGGQGFLEGLTRGGVPGAIMGGVGGAVAGAVDKSSDERYDQQRRVGRYQRQRGELVQREGEQLKLDDARAGVRLKNAQAGYAERRPDIDAAKADERRLKDERARIFRVLSSLKGQKLDPADPRVRQLQTDADRADVPFDVESFNNSKGNVVRYTRVDPEHPERTQEVERNVVTGEETVLGQRGYQATRGADGRTTAEVKTDEDRDRAYEATQEYRKQLLSMAGDRFQLALTNGLSAGAAREFNVATAGLQQRVGQIRTQIEGWRSKAKAFTVDPAEAERRIQELEAQADPLLQQIEDARTRALGQMSSPGLPSTRTTPAPSGGRTGRYAGQRMPRANLPAAAKALGLSESEAEALITREGGIVY